MSTRTLLWIALFSLIFACGLPAYSAPVDVSLFDRLQRRISAPIIGGRIADIEGVPGNPAFYVATASGGRWKTINAGTSWAVGRRRSTLHQQSRSMHRASSLLANPSI